MDDERRRRKLAILVIVIAVILAAWFLSIHHEIDVEVEGEGTVDPSDAIVRHLGSAEFRIVPAEGWRISLVEVDGEAVEIEDGVLRLERVVSDHKIRVVFAEEEEIHVLTVASNDGGTTDPEGTVKIRCGETVVVRISADDGYVVDDVLLDGVSQGSSNRVDVLMDSDHALQVVFRKAVDDPGAGGHADPWVYIDVDVQVETIGAEYGHVDPTGRVRVAYGGSLTVEIHLNEGYSVKRITVNGSDIEVSDVFTVTDIVESIDIELVILHSVEKRHSVTASASTGGSISPSGTISVVDGGSIEFTVSADGGYHLLRLTVDGSPVQAIGGRFVLSDITDNHTVRAEFARDRPVGPSLTSITAAGAPAYCYVGENLDVSDLVVTAFYSDGTFATVTGYSLSETSWTSPGGKTVAVEYGGRTTSFHVLVPTLESIALTSGPTRTVYGIGDSFDPSGMVVEAGYSEGVQYKRVVVPVIDSGVFDSVGDIPVALSYTEGSNTVETSVTVKVVDRGGFQVFVSSYSGERMVDGSVRTFVEYPDIRLSGFEFDLKDIVPGMTQAVTLEIRNGSGRDLQSLVMVEGLTGSEDFAKQIFISCGSVSSTVFDANNGTLLDLGIIPSGSTVSAIVTIEFMEGADNNSVLGHSLNFRLAVFADEA